MLKVKYMQCVRWSQFNSSRNNNKYYKLITIGFNNDIYIFKYLMGQSKKNYNRNKIFELNQRNEVLKHSIMLVQPYQNDKNTKD